MRVCGACWLAKKRIVSLWKFIGLFFIQLGLWIFSYVYLFSSLCIFHGILLWQTCSIRFAHLSSHRTHKYSDIIKWRRTHIHRTVAPIHYSFRIVILFERSIILLLAFAMRLIPLSVTIFPPIWRLFALTLYEMRWDRWKKKQSKAQVNQAEMQSNNFTIGWRTWKRI